MVFIEAESVVKFGVQCLWGLYCYLAFLTLLCSCPCRKG